MNKLTIGILLAFSAILATAQAATPRFHPNHLFIKLKAGQSMVKSPLIKSSKRIIGQLYLVKTNKLEALKQELSGLDSIEYAQNDFYGEKRKMPKLEVLDAASLAIKGFTEINFVSFNDPDAAKLWAFNSTSGMSVNEAYDLVGNRAAAEVIVAVVDTGVDHNHEDLKDIMWTNEQEIAANGIDDDNNGYIDDIHGINTLVRDAQGRATMNTMASHWHGTHVSGTIAATQNNGLGIAGVASNVKIMALRTVPDDSDELDSDIVEAYLYAAKQGARIINCSFGKAVNEGGMIVRDTINEIGKKYNVLVIASAGNDSMGPMSWHNNDNSPKYPASFDSESMLVIASTTSSGSLSTFSNIGPKTVDVAAPGSNIYSTINGGKYGMASGTSMASPNTSGAAAMVLGYYPNLSATELKSVLMKSVTPVASFKSQLVSGGRINMKNALQKAKKVRRFQFLAK
ncbi:MAG: S8 family serine peptidase [Bdellovibrionales bacterium]|nr:S8 family serine peptidase [Bdellovibrionales bacterium]